MQSKEFYQEANGMSPGWGNYLRKIDRLRERVDAGRDITVKEACWILYAESRAESTEWLAFQTWTIRKKLSTRRFAWPIWLALFEGYRKEQDDARAREVS